ncbi:DUF1778 domain-containing protein [Sphingomonas sp. ZT3P38]|uniref:type II toxin-antitoxin system TacA family antitoxin n=1 Tax=Parasphingomonas zepuensis TaxID=3096161 RepID=UPI002FC605AD
MDEQFSVCYCHTVKGRPMRREAPIVSVRVNREERAMLEAAAEHARTNISDFVRRKALEAAEIDMLDRRQVTIPAEDWDRFETWVRAPGKDIPALRRLSATPPAWQD